MNGVKRADALRNRVHIIEVARAVFADDAGASLNEIAKRAQVGAGTLYRHFPTREDLMLAVYQHEIDRITDSTSELLAMYAPVDALRFWTADLVRAMRQKHGLGDALTPSVHKAITEQSYGPVIAAITRLLDAGKQESVIRADADPRDYLQFTGALWRSALGTEDRSGTMLELLLDAFRTKPEGDGGQVLDEGPFYHGTRADLEIGALLSAGFKSNYKPEITMNHIYFTALPNGAGLAAELSRGNGRERVYIVEPTGDFENDPNVTDKKFPGNPTRSYRSKKPLRVIGELDDWVRLTPEQLADWRNKIANIKGDIIN